MKHFFCCLFFFFLLPPFLLFSQAQAAAKRSFDDIFPGVPADIRAEAFSGEGFSKSSARGEGLSLVGSGRNASGGSAIDSKIIQAVLGKEPGFLIESLLVIPGGNYTLLDAYNALGKVRGLKGRLYNSHTRGEAVPLFEDVTRIESAKKNNPVPDPAPAARIPPSETVYMRLKDANFGNSFYRGDMALGRGSIIYSLSNNRALTYFMVPVIKEEKFTAQFYFEPIREGMLIYSLAGADVSDFVASRINMPSAISKRLAVITGWIAEGITGG